jgi:hypothetical protein
MFIDIQTWIITPSHLSSLKCYLTISVGQCLCEICCCCYSYFWSATSQSQLGSACVKSAVAVTHIFEMLHPRSQLGSACVRSAVAVTHIFEMLHPRSQLGSACVRSAITHILVAGGFCHLLASLSTVHCILSLTAVHKIGVSARLLYLWCRQHVERCEVSSFEVKQGLHFALPFSSTAIIMLYLYMVQAVGLCSRQHSIYCSR